MHGLGVAILLGYLSGLEGISSRLVAVMLAAVFMLPLEVMGVLLQWLFYEPYPNPSFRKFFGYGLLSAAIGATFTAVVVATPEQGSSQALIALTLAGAGAASYSLIVIHILKARETE